MKVLVKILLKLIFLISFVALSYGEEKKENIYSNIDEMLSGTLNKNNEE